jgi:hypothetical protein
MTQKSALRSVPASTTCGADILLARHGSHIVSLRVDPRTDTTLAQLDGGRWVSARNHLVLPRATPARRLVAGWVDYKSGQTAIKPEDVRWVGKLTGWWMLGVAAFGGLAAGLISVVS